MFPKHLNRGEIPSRDVLTDPSCRSGAPIGAGKAVLVDLRATGAERRRRLGCGAGRQRLCSEWRGTHDPEAKTSGTRRIARAKAAGRRPSFGCSKTRGKSIGAAVAETPDIALKDLKRCLPSVVLLPASVNFSQFFHRQVAETSTKCLTRYNRSINLNSGHRASSSWNGISSCGRSAV